MKGSGNLSVSRSLNWINGFISGTSAVNIGGGASLNISGNPTIKTLRQRTINAASGATTTWTGSGSISGWDNAVL